MPQEQPFYMVQLSGAGVPTHRHWSRESAVLEAKRLLRQHYRFGHTSALVLKAECLIEVTEFTETQYVVSRTEPADDLPF